MQVSSAFLSEGGTEIAPMSATTDMEVALRYALRPREGDKQHRYATLFRIVSTDVASQGVDIHYLSCFPEENEHLFPPLTYLKPRWHQRLGPKDFKGHNMTIDVIEVTPTVVT